MNEKKSLEELLAEKQAGLERMKARQDRVNGRIADHIEKHPGCIGPALDRVRRRLKNVDRTWPLAKEWEHILSNWDLPKIVAIFRDQCAYHEQLRACSPFMLPHSSEEE